MASDDLMILMLLGIPVVAYIAIPDFRKQIDTGLGIGVSKVPYIPIPGQSGNCYNTPTKEHPSGTKTCWRNRACGAAAGTTVALCIGGPGRCTDARNAWLQAHGCKSKMTYSYAGGYLHNPTENRISIS